MRLIPLTISFSFPTDPGSTFNATVKITFQKIIAIRFIRWPNPINDTIVMYGDELSQFTNLSSNSLMMFTKSAKVARANNFFSYTPYFPGLTNPTPRQNNYKDFTEYLTPAYKTKNLYIKATADTTTVSSVTIGYEKK